MEAAGAMNSNPREHNKIALEAAGIEPVRGGKPNMVTLRDFGRIGFKNRELPRRLRFAPVPPSPPDSPRVMEVFWRQQGRFPRPG